MLCPYLWHGWLVVGGSFVVFTGLRRFGDGFRSFSMTPKTDALGLTGPSYTRAGGQISEGSSCWLLICSLQLDYFQLGARMWRPAAPEVRACKRWSQPASGKTTGGVSQLQAKPPASRQDDTKFVVTQKLLVLSLHDSDLDVGFCGFSMLLKTAALQI